MPTSDPRRAGLTRRGLLAAGAAGVVGASLQSCTGSSDRAGDNAGDGASEPTPRPTEPAPDLPMVRPFSSDQAYRSFGVAAHPSHRQAAYQFTEEWMARLSDMGVTYFRGFYAHDVEETPAVTGLARRHGLGWGMTVCSGLDESEELLERRIAHIAANAADVCLYVEGINEPNYDRGGGKVPTDWPETTARLQKVIWNAVRSHPSLDDVPILGPSLQAQVAGPADYRRLRRLGILRNLDIAGVHSYPNGYYPDRSLDERLQVVEQQWPDVPIWITEFSWPASAGLLGSEAFAGMPTFQTDHVGQARRLADTLPRLARSRVRLGIERVFWYTWLSDDVPGLSGWDHSGLRRVRGERVVNTPAYDVFRRMSRVLRGCGDPVRPRACRVPGA